MDDPNKFLEMLNIRIKNAIAQIYTALPGELLSISGNFATVKPTVTKDLPDGRSLPFPAISNVLVVFPTGKKGATGVTFPVEAGDTGLLVFASQSMDGFTSGGQASDPRRHDLTDCIFVPGLWPFELTVRSEYPDETVLFNQGSMLRVASDKVICNVDMEIEGNVKIGKKLTVTQGTTSNGVTFEGHVHGNVQNGPNDTSTPKQGGA